MNSEIKKVKNVQVLSGTVVSNKSDKTISVQIERKVKHPKYEKFVKKLSKIQVHDPFNQAKVGNIVLIQETKPISKTKAWELVKILNVSEA